MWRAGCDVTCLRVVADAEGVGTAQPERHMKGRIPHSIGAERMECWLRWREDGAGVAFIASPVEAERRSRRRSMRGGGNGAKRSERGKVYMATPVVEIDWRLKAYPAEHRFA